MRFQSMLGVALAFALSAGVAQGAELDAFFGNTLVVKDGKGKEVSRTTFAQDGSYSITRGGKTAKGTWRLQGSALCTTEEGSDEEDCADLQLTGRNKGDNWSVSNGGVTMQLSLEAGE